MKRKLLWILFSLAGHAHRATRAIYYAIQKRLQREYASKRNKIYNNGGFV